MYRKKVSGFLGSRGSRQLAALAFSAAVASVLALPAQAADMANGSRVYNSRCAGCHGAAGRSLNPAAPNLIGGTKTTMQSDTALMLRIKTGKGQCPPYLGLLKDTDILDVIAHLRTLR